ncbi:MAG: chromate resistance protein ChrB domain-containing protein [Bacillota bacterium]
MKWVTRANAHVDRVACPWLITRFIDPSAEFVFIDPEKDPMPDDATPFDMKGVKLGHHAGKCSFEVIIDEYRLDDPALVVLAKVVHGADITMDVGLIPESAGLEAIARGFMLSETDDHKKLQLEFPMYDALYSYAKDKLAKA